MTELPPRIPAAIAYLARIAATPHAFHGGFLCSALCPKFRAAGYPLAWTHAQCGWKLEGSFWLLWAAGRLEAGERSWALQRAGPTPDLMAIGRAQQRPALRGVGAARRWQIPPAWVPGSGGLRLAFGAGWHCGVVRRSAQSAGAVCRTVADHRSYCSGALSLPCRHL